MTTETTAAASAADSAAASAAASADGGGDGGGGDFRNDAAPGDGDALLRALGRLFGLAPGDGEVAPDEIVGLGLSDADLATLGAAGFAVLSVETLGALGGRLHRLAPPAALGLEAALDAARAAAPGATLDFNHLYAGAGDPTCAGPECWPAAMTGLAPLPSGACVRGAPVAIIDTAVNAGHPALRGARIERRSFLSDGLAPAPPDHGTAVAALLVGRPGAAAPLAPGAALLAAEAFAQRDGRSRADAAAVVRGLDWAVARRARVIGLSLAGSENLLVSRAVELAARRANVLAAAGNDGPRARPAHPAAHPDVIAVAAVDARRRVWRGGNRGAYVELAAPGVEVISAGPGPGLAPWTGTSFAVPFAVAAMLRARAETGGDPTAARGLLTRTAEALGGSGRDAASGYGLVRAPGRRCY